MSNTDNKIEVTVKATGEVLEFPCGTPQEAIASWDLVESTLEAYKQARRQLIEASRDMLRGN